MKEGEDEFPDKTGILKNFGLSGNKQFESSGGNRKA